MTDAHHGQGEKPAVPWRVRDDVAVSGDARRVLVLPLRPIGSAPMELSGVGLEIWRLVDGERGIDAIVDELCRRFDADPAGVNDDVTAFLKQLEAAEVLERRDPDAGPIPQT